MKSLFFLIVFSTTTFIQQAQTDSLKYSLPELIVTATKTETSSLQLASSVSVITAKDIARSKKISVVEILRGIPGISIVQQGGPGRLAGINIRGAEAEHTLILVDGVEMNDPSSPGNSYDLSIIQLTDVERIEIVRGAQSTLYGSDAMSGVVNIITKKVKDNISFSAEGGSNAYYRGSGNVSQHLESFDFSLNFSRLKTNGISAISTAYGNNERDNYENNSISSSVDFRINQNIDIEFLYKYIEAKAGLDQADKNGDDPNFTYDTEEHVFSGAVKFSLFENKWKQRVAISQIRKIGMTNDDTDAIHPATSLYNFSNSRRFKLDWQNNLFFLKNHLISFGIETEKEFAETELKTESEFGLFESIFPEKNVRSSGAYLQSQSSFGNVLFVTAGLRYDNHEKFGGISTFRIAPAYLISSTQTKIKATYGTGFKAPSLFWLYDPAFGNPGLRAEKSYGWDAGIEQFLLNNKLLFEFTYFHLEFDKMLGFDENFKTVNIDKAETEGLETVVSINPYGNFSFLASYTYTKAIDKSPGVTDENKNLIRRPEHKMTIEMNYLFTPSLNVNTRLRYNGKREDIDFSTFPSKRVTLESYSVVDIAASYQLGEFLNLFGRVENLFDTNYEEVLYYGTMGRSFYAGASLTF